MIQLAHIYGLFDPRHREGRVHYYVGKSINPGDRFRSHIKEAKKPGGPTRKNNWIKSLLKEGVEPSYQIIETCTVETVDERERYWILHFSRHHGYTLLNHTTGGDGGNHFTPESARRHRQAIINSFADGSRKQRLAEWMRAQWKDPVFRAARIARMTGIKRTPEHIAKLTGRRLPCSPERRAAISAGHLRRPRRAVLNVTTEQRFASTDEAAQSVQGGRVEIAHYIRIQKPYRGFLWSWTT